MQPTSRQAYLDWLRIMAILGVLFFHSAMAFVAEWEWHIKNKETSYLLLEFNSWLHRFRMPLLFFISGTVTHFMLQKKSSASFIGLRFRRLFIPLLVGLFVVVPPQIYMERLTQGFKGSFWDFYPTVFNFRPYPKGNTSWHHLWFIAYLFVYDVALAPLFKWSMSEQGKNKLAFINRLAKAKWIYLLIIPNTVIFTCFSLNYPETNNLLQDGCYFFYWLFFLLAGFICIQFPLLMDSLETNRRFSLMIAFLSLLLVNYLRWNKLEPWIAIDNWRSDWRTYAYLMLEAVTAWTWVFAAVGYGKKYLNKKLPVLDYINQAVYPFYILHQTVIVILVYYVVQTSDTVGMKYTFTVIVTFVITMAIYHLLIKPFAVMRFLFGMKPQKKEKPVRREPSPAKQEPVIDLAS